MNRESLHCLTVEAAPWARGEREVVALARAAPSLHCSFIGEREREREKERRERASALCFKLHSLGSSLNSSGGSSIAASLSVRQKTEAALWWFAIRAPLSLSVIATYSDSTAVDESTVERDFLR